jgi:hypothetical protein
MKIIIAFIAVLLSAKINAQTSNYSSPKNIVWKANGNEEYILSNKSTFFMFHINNSGIASYHRPGGISYGTVYVSNFSKYYESTIKSSYEIYKIKLQDNGDYDFWTHDIGDDGQIVLFTLRKNAAQPDITEYRYSPLRGSNVVLKTVQYILD